MTSEKQLTHDQNNYNSSNLIVKFVRKTWNEGISFVDRLIDLTFNKKQNKQQKKQQENILYKIELQIPQISKKDTARSIFKEFNQAKKLYQQSKFIQKKQNALKTPLKIINRDQSIINNEIIMLEQTQASFPKKQQLNELFNQLTTKKTNKLTIQKSKLTISRQQFIFVQSKPNLQSARKYFLVKNQLNHEQKITKNQNSQKEQQGSNFLTKTNTLDKDRVGFGIVNMSGKSKGNIKMDLSTVFQSSLQDKSSQFKSNQSNVHTIKQTNIKSYTVDNQSLINKLQDVKIKNNPFAMSLLDKDNSSKNKVDLKLLINERKNILFSNPTQKPSFISHNQQKTQIKNYLQMNNPNDINKTSKFNIKLTEKIDLIGKANPNFTVNLLSSQNKQKQALNHPYNKTPNLFSSSPKPNESIPKLNMANVTNQKDTVQSKFTTNTSNYIKEYSEGVSVINSTANKNNMFQFKKHSTQMFGLTHQSDVNKQANIMFGLNKPINNMLMGPKPTNSIFGTTQPQNQPKPDRSYERRRNKKQQRIK